MADKIVDGEIGVSEMPTVLMETTTAGKDPYIQPIDPTSTTSTTAGTLPRKTTGQQSIPVYSSYSDKLTTTDQFPMQHATTQLQPSTVPLATTDYVADEPYDTDLASNESSSQKPISSDSVSKDSVSTSSTSSSVAATSSDIPVISASKSDTSIPDTDSIAASLSSSASASSASAALSTSTSSPSTTDFIKFVPGTDSAKSATTQKVLITSTSSIDPHVTTKSQPSSSDYVPSTGDAVAPVTASRTTIGSSAIALDTVSVKSTSAVPLTPPPSNVKPVTPESQGTSILGGGLSDYIVYVGAPLCGLAILILLIVCILCLRKRKAKSKGSPAKAQVQDLWVNSQAEIPLCNRSPLLEPRVGDRHIAEKDLAEKSSNLRRRKPAKATVDDDPSVVETVGKTHVDDVSPETNNLDIDALKEKLDDADIDEGLTTYEAVFDFPAEQDTHLNLQQGDLVKVTRKEDNGWWRGTVDNRIGWFPSNYVQAAPQDKMETENEVEMHNDSHLSSFLSKKSYEPSPRNSYPTEEEIEAEPIYCKIQPKEKRKSTPKIPDKVTPPQQLVNRENTPIPIEAESRFKATYTYEGRSHGELTLKVGDIILGKEQDRNGWMNGCNETTGDEGWFPSVYVEKFTEDKPPSPASDADQDSVSLDPDPTSYRHLDANTRPESTADLVGIVHRAVHTFEGEKAGDLEFQEGDHITVFQVLENGWWLGCKDKTVGWFPGSYVQMIDQPSPVAKTTPSPSPIKEEPDTPDLNNGEATPKKSRLRPVRKAPPPPKVDTPPAKVDTPPESKIPSPISKIPKKGIPVRTSPSVPSESVKRSSTGTEPKVSPDNSNNNDVKSDFKPEPLKPLHDGLYDLLDLPEEAGSGGSKPGVQDPGKPQVPKRYIKPKLVTVPRSQVNLPQDSELHGDSVRTENRRSRPPPPRPNPPRINRSFSVKLEAPRSPGHMSQSEDEDTGFFHLNNPVRVNDILRQDSSEPEIDTSPYKGMSSFGSSFGLSFGRVEDKPKPTHSSFNVSPVVPRVEQKSHHFGAPNTSNSRDLGDDTQTLSDTSPVVFNNDNKGRQQNDQFMVNSNGMYPGRDNTRVKDHYETVIPADSNKQTENAHWDTDVSRPPVMGQESAEIAVTPMSPKKKDKPSRLAPPKPVSLALENTTEQKESPKPHPQSGDSSGSSTSSLATSKLPKAQSSGEPVSKLPVIGKKDTPVRAEESRLQKPVVHSEQHPAPPTNNIPVPNDVPVTVNNNTSVNNDDKRASPQMKYSDENSVNNNNSYEDPSRPRTDSFDKPRVAPKPKPKGLPKLLPKPKAGLKASSREDDVDNEYNDRGNSSDSSLPTTPVKKVHPDSSLPTTPVKKVHQDSSLPTTPVKKIHPETVEKDDSAKEDEAKPCKIPLGSKIAQKSPQQRGRKSGIPASPGMRNKSKDRKDVLQGVGKGSDTDKAAGSGRKVSESDSDAPMSPVSNIRRKPESPAGARRLKKGEGVLRNRSNSPHERKALPISLKQRSNSPASKLPRSGIPKAGASSPANTPSPNGPTSGLVQPKPVNHDQVIQSPKGGPNSRVDTTPSPDSFYEGQENLSPKPERPSKPPQVQKQKSQDGKPKQGKSLLPVIHKNMDATSPGQNGVAPSPGSKPKRGIPVAKPPRPPAPKSPSETPDQNEFNKRTLYQAVRAYRAQTEEELSFTEGTFIKELSDCDRPGWYVGMLADGTTGLYPANHFKPSPVSAQSEA